LDHQIGSLPQVGPWILSRFPDLKPIWNLDNKQAKNENLCLKRDLFYLFLFIFGEKYKCLREKKTARRASGCQPVRFPARRPRRERGGERPLQMAVPIQPPDDLGCGERDELRARSWAVFSSFGKLRNIGRRSGWKGQSGKELGKDRYHLMVIILFQTLNKNEGMVDHPRLQRPRLAASFFPTRNSLIKHIRWHKNTWQRQGTGKNESERSQWTLP
jgi:hypothetical protein